MVNKKIFGTTTSIILWFISTAVASTVAGCLLFLFYETPFSQSKSNEINVLKKEVQEYKKTLCKQPSVVIVQTSNKEKVDMENFVERVENFYEKRLNTLLAVFTAIISIVGIALPIVSMFLQDNHYKDNMSAIIDMKERANNNEIAIKNLLNKTRVYLPIALSAGKKAQRAQDNAEAAIKKLTDNTINMKNNLLKCPLTGMLKMLQTTMVWQEHSCNYLKLIVKIFISRMLLFIFLLPLILTSKPIDVMVYVLI